MSLPGILGTNVHLEGADNYLDTSATFTFKAGSTLALQASHATAILDALGGSPAKGSLSVRGSSTWATLAVGTDGYVLTADSTSPNGVKWAAAGGGGSGTVTNTSGNLTAHALIIGNGTVDVKALGSLGTTTTVLHGNASGDPSFGAVALGTDVSGTLPVANGGTNLASYTAGDILYASGTTTLAKLGIGSAGNLLGISAGIPAWTSPGANPSATISRAATNGTATTFLRSDGAPAISSSFADQDLTTTSVVQHGKVGIAMAAGHLLDIQQSNGVAIAAGDNGGTGPLCYLQVTSATSFDFVSRNNHPFTWVMFPSGPSTVMTLSTGGGLTIAGAYTSAAPAGGSGAGAWKLGTRISGTFTADLTKAVELDIGGTLIRLAVLT